MTNTDLTQQPPARPGTNNSGGAFRRELALIPGWAYALALVTFGAVQAAMHLLIPRDSNAPPFGERVFLGVVAGSVLVLWVLLIGYVNRDSKRRGMNPTLWTLLVIFVPNALGFILYFLIRKPMQVPCGNCGTMLQPNYRFCPKCSTPRYPVCGHCNTPVQVGDLFCNNCGRMLHEPMK